MTRLTDKTRALERVMEIAERISSLPVLDPRTPDEIIGYDEHGIPATEPDPQGRADRKSMAQLFAESPFNGLNMGFERELDCGRDVDL